MAIQVIKDSLAKFWKIENTFFKICHQEGYIVSNFLGHPVLLNGKRRRTSAHIKSLLVESPNTEGSVCRKMKEEPGVGGTRE